MNLVSTAVLSTLFVWHIVLVEADTWTPIPSNHNGPLPARQLNAERKTTPVFRKQLKTSQVYYLAQPEARADQDQQRRDQLLRQRPVRQDPFVSTDEQLLNGVDVPIENNSESNGTTIVVPLPIEEIIIDNNVTVDDLKPNDDEPINTEDDLPIVTDDVDSQTDSSIELAKEKDRIETSINESLQVGNGTNDFQSNLPSDQDEVINEKADEEGGDLLNLFSDALDEFSQINNLVNITKEGLKNITDMVDNLGKNVVQLETEIGQTEREVLLLQQDIKRAPTLQTIYGIVQQVVQQSTNNYPSYKQPTYQTYPQTQQNYPPVQNHLQYNPPNPIYRSYNTVPVILQYGRNTVRTRQKRDSSDIGNEIVRYEKVVPKENCVSLNQTVVSQLLLCVENQKQMALLKSDEKEPLIKNAVTDFCSTIL